VPVVRSEEKGNALVVHRKLQELLRLRQPSPVTTLDVSEVERRLWAAAVEWMAEWPAALMGTALAMRDGTWWVPSDRRRLMSESDSGLVYEKFAELRKEVGVLKAKKKDGVRFKVRSADELADRVRPVAERLGLLIYPVGVEGKGHVVEGGTLAEATITLRIRAIADGSHFDIQGFGLGADNQDKAGGKAGTYAWKTALVQALTAGGEKDTDDSDTPIAGGVKPQQRKAPAPQGVQQTTRAEVDSMVAEARAGRDLDKLRRALAMAGYLSEADQGELAVAIKAASAEIRGAA
jgi:hypothetical protein